jgi:hypothetical protein
MLTAKDITTSTRFISFLLSLILTLPDWTNTQSVFFTRLRGQRRALRPTAAEAAVDCFDSGAA